MCGCVGPVGEVSRRGEGCVREAWEWEEVNWEELMGQKETEWE